MPDVATLRDSTQIELPRQTLDEADVCLESEFVVTVFREGDVTRVIGSPVEIKRVSDFLARNGVSLR
ncbi:MAG: hypothetical protein ABEJ68_07965 [Halobacteriaceae archaeon]